MNLLSETICGDQCMYQGDTCICGNNSYSFDDMLSQHIYCCIPTEPNETCEFEEFVTESNWSYKLTCKNGTANHVDEKCFNMCPYSQGKK